MSGNVNAGAGGNAGGGQASGNAGGAAGGSAGQGGAAGGSAGGAAGAASGGNGGSGATDWTSGFADDAKGFVQNKGWKGPSDVLESYRNLEKLHGGGPENLLKLPKTDDAAEWGPIFDRLGRPKEAKDYGIKAEEGKPNDFADWASGVFHKNGLSAKQAQALASDWNEFQKSAVTSQTAAGQAKLATERDALKKDWGGAYDQHMAQAKAAVREFGISGDVIDKMESAAGYSAVMKAFQKIGSKIGESNYVDGGKGNGGMSSEQAMEKISRLGADQAFMQRYIKGDVTAKAEMERLQQHAHPGEMFI